MFIPNCLDKFQKTKSNLGLEMMVTKTFLIGTPYS